MVDFEFETAGDFVPGANTEWDVFHMLPGDDAPVYLATLYSAYYKTFRPELNGPGAASFAINRSSPECTETILAQGNLVKIRVPEIHDDYIFAFFLETGDFTLISSQEAGGETLTFGGRGILSYLEYGRAWSESYITGGQDPIAGVWRAYAAGTGSAPGQILRRLIDEFQDADRPQFPIPHLTVDFDYDNDSTADPWDETDATDEFAYQVGEDGLAIVQRLIDTQTIIVQMSPDFVLSAYNIDNYGRDLSGDAFGAGVVRFERGVNIATELRRELAVLEVQTHMLAAGEDDKYGTAALSDAADRVTKEGYIAAFGTGTATLDGIASAELMTRLGKSDTIMFPIANRRTADVVLVDPVSAGAPIGPLAVDGYYLPGPEGTLGDFWVGDTVRVHTGTDPFDYTETNAIVDAITITREDENKELIVIPELKTRETVEAVMCTEGECQRFNTGYDVTIPDCVVDGDVLVTIFSGRTASTGQTVGPDAWTEAAAVNAYNATQYPGPGPNTRVVVWYREWNTGDSPTVHIENPGAGTQTQVIVLKGVSGAPTVTSGTLDTTVNDNISIGPTAGGGTLVGVFGFQRNDAWQQNDGFAVNPTGDTTTVSPAGASHEEICGVTWSPRRWIGMVEGASALTLTGTMADPGNQETVWGTSWVGLYWT